MKQNIHKAWVILILLCSLTVTTFAQLTIRQYNVTKTTTPTTTVALPVISWKSPSLSYYKSSTNIQHLEVCITSNEKPSDIALYINGVRQNFRDFNIVPVNNGCDYIWKISLNFSQIGQYFLDLEVTNSAGKNKKRCVIEIIPTNNLTIKKNNINTNVSGNRRALVIGNSAYAEKPLVNPTNDANDMAARLRQLGFSVDVYTNLDKRRTISAVNNFSNKIKKNDIALFFYAGHGYQINGVSYLLPIGYNIASAADAEYEGYRIDRILGNMQEAGAGVNLMFLDACRNSPIRSLLSRSLNTNGLAFPKTQPSGSLIAFATAAGSTAADGTGRNGVYTSALLSCLQRGESINNILTLVTGKVKRTTALQQIPEYKSSLDNIFKF